jgi:hypothetical protein
VQRVQGLRRSNAARPIPGRRRYDEDSVSDAYEYDRGTVYCRRHRETHLADEACDGCLAEARRDAR